MAPISGFFEVGADVAGVLGGTFMTVGAVGAVVVVARQGDTSNSVPVTRAVKEKNFRLFIITRAYGSGEVGSTDAGGVLGSGAAGA